MRALADVNGETWEQCEELVRKTLSDKLDMDEDDGKQIPVERAHRHAILCKHNNNVYLFKTICSLYSLII